MSGQTQTNVSGNLSPFAHITPCGIADVALTSIEKETGVTHEIKDVAARTAEISNRL